MDERPRRVQLARDLFDAVCACAPLNPKLRILDIGCGRGLLVAPHVKSVLGVDTSHGMLEVQEAKHLGACVIIMLSMQNGYAQESSR